MMDLSCRRSPPYHSGPIIWRSRRAHFATCITRTGIANELVIGAYYFFQASLEGTALDQNAGNNSALARLDTLGNVLEVLQPDPLSGSTFIADVQSDGQGALYLCDASGEVAFTNDTILCLSQDTYLSKVEPVIFTSLGPEDPGPSLSGNSCPIRPATACNCFLMPPRTGHHPSFSAAIRWAASFGASCPQVIASPWT